MPAVLLDRDGVINRLRPGHVTRWGEFSFLPGSLEALAALQVLGMRLAVVTNQPAVGRGLMTADALDEIHRRMRTRCALAGATIEAVFACPHAGGDGCACRKPKPGLLLAALAALNEPPERCTMIGDSIEDMDAARAAGLPFILVRTGRGRETLARLGNRPALPFVVDDLWEAAQAVQARYAPLLKAA